MPSIILLGRGDSTKFKDIDHRQFYEYLFRASGTINDGYHRGLFYMLSLLPDTRKHIKDLYNIERDEIRAAGLLKPWQTSGSIQATRLAFNLFNGFNGSRGDRKIESEHLYTPYELLNGSLCEYCLEACRLRFYHSPQYERQTINEEYEEPEWE